MHLHLLVCFVHEILQLPQVVVLVNCPRVVVLALLYHRYFFELGRHSCVVELLSLEWGYDVVIHPSYEEEGSFYIWYDVDSPPTYLQEERLEPANEDKVLIYEVRDRREGILEDDAVYHGVVLVFVVGFRGYSAS